MIKAKELIQDLEVHSRKFYCGFIGINKPNDKQFFVNLRCMELMKNTALLYVGGGITRDSNALNEWKETNYKAKTLIKALK